jgi:hypothetical protein
MAGSAPKRRILATMFLAIVMGGGGCPFSDSSPTTTEPRVDPLEGVSAIQVRPGLSTETGGVAVGSTRAYVVVNSANNALIALDQFELTLRDAAGTGATTFATLVNGNQVSCQSAGRVTLIAKARSKPALQASATIDCATRTVAIISEPAGKTVVAGTSFTYSAELREPNGSPVPGGWTFAWSASDQTIAQMGTSGGLLAVRSGTVTLTAASAGATAATTTLTVTAAAAFVQSPGGSASDPANSKVNLVVGGTRQYQLANTSTGALVTGTLVWSSSSAAVATITGNGGLATCTGPGTTVIGGTNGGTFVAKATLTCQ